MTTPAVLQPARRQLLRGLAALPLAAALVPGSARATTSGRLRLAVVPQLTAVEMNRNWAPLVDALAAAGLPCELVIHASIPKFEPEFLQGRADLAFLNPYHMVMARRVHGYVPLLRDRRPLEGVLLVRKDAAVTGLIQLQGQRISFPAPNALAASLYIRAALEREHRLRYEAHFAQNHRNAVRQVLVGDSVAAGVVRTTYEMEPPEVRQALRALYVTPELASHPLAVHPRVPATQRQAIVRTLLGLAQDPARQSLMAAIQMPHPIAADYARDYEPLNRLGIEKYVVTE
jgi:phosphonate transport system substrate-binding protein